MTEFEEKCIAEMAEVVGALGKVLARLEKLERLSQTSDSYLRSIEHSCKEIYLELPGKGNWDFKCRGSQGSSSSFF